MCKLTWLRRVRELEEDTGAKQNKKCAHKTLSREIERYNYLKLEKKIVAAES